MKTNTFLLLTMFTCLGVALNSAEAATGEAHSTNKKGIISFSLNGQAAMEVDQTLTDATRITLGSGANKYGAVKGKQVTCVTKKATTDNISRNECSFSVDDNGSLNASLYSSEAASTGTVKTQLVAGRVLVKLSGNIAEQILKAMKNVSEYGTMTTNKDSGEIRCSMIREFKIGNASCTFYIDSAGSTTSK